jgi:hypothetical protein
MTTIGNPRVEEIRLRVRTSYNELNQLLDSLTTNMDTTHIYQSPSQLSLHLDDLYTIQGFN